MPEEEEESFRFVDKRRGAQQSETSSTEDSALAEEKEGEDELPESLDPSPGGLPQLSIRDRILMSIDILHQGAWINLGLRADPATGEVEQNLASARIAIDCVAFLASKVEGELDDQSKRELKRIVSDLQMNFVNQSQRAQSQHA